MGESDIPSHVQYSAVTGFFLQDDPATEPSGFDFTQTNFGLIDQAYDTDDSPPDSVHTKTQWQRFEKKLAHLNEMSGSKVQYKILFLGRHGEGFHNVAEAQYGTKVWDCYWSCQDGDSTLTWADALLTPVGIAQAQKANAFWSHLLKIQAIPAPQSYYSSPLVRCLDTAFHTFDGLDLPNDRPFAPEIKELLREVIGVHTCDRRSSKSFIADRYPAWRFENAFAEDDPLWKADERESDEGREARVRRVLDDIFGTDPNTWISISSHSGAIESFLRVLGHREFDLGTGQAIPVLVKAETVQGKAPSSTGTHWTRPSTCTSPPASSTS